MLTIDLKGKRAFVAGVADDGGFGFSIAKHLAEAGATVCVGTWPPAYTIFTKSLARGKFSDSLKLSSGGELSFERIYPLDADFDTDDDVPDEVRDSRRYRDHTGYSIQGVADKLVADFGDKPLDIVVHSLANGPEVKQPLLRTSRGGYLAAIGTSAYSFVGMVSRFGPLLRPDGSFLCLSFLASERCVPGYGGGMSSAKAALESDTRTLAYEAGRVYGARINCVSAGAWGSRAATAIGFIGNMIEYAERNAPIPQKLDAREVGAAAAFLCSPLAAGITGTTVYVDKGLHTMGVSVDAVPNNLEG
ncbi:MAG: enoyl-[acyl-carrier-protein] reductase [Myxococcales bacterium]|nr:enoyl-[acyl-carrier-protein] reductase [Myxococcales bacterium]MDD9964661.1 enoyl-[acyl-carrier-protein] reductase [Myxococcales bacterium]